MHRFASGYCTRQPSKRHGRSRGRAPRTGRTASGSSQASSDGSFVLVDSASEAEADAGLGFEF